MKTHRLNVSHSTVLFLGHPLSLDPPLSMQPSDDDSQYVSLLATLLPKCLLSTFCDQLSNYSKALFQMYPILIKVPLLDPL